MPYLRGSCREGRRGSATIPGLNVLPLSPYPSIQLGLLPLASPWKKFRRKGGGKRINHAAEKRQPRSAGGSSEPGGPVHLRHGRPVSPSHPAARPRPRHPSFASPPMSQRPRAPPPRAPPSRARVSSCWEGGREGGEAAQAVGPTAKGTWGTRGPRMLGASRPLDLAATPHWPGWLRRSGLSDDSSLPSTSHLS